MSRSAMLARSRWRSAPAGCAFALVFASSAHAGDRTPLSSLPALAVAPEPKELANPTDIEGLKIEESGSEQYRYWMLRASKTAGYCLVNREGGFQLTTSSSWDARQDQELWRFTETEGKAKLERVRLRLASDQKRVHVKSRQTLEPALVSSSNSVRVWGFREDNDHVTLLARGAGGGRETQGLRKPEDDETFQFASSDCAYGGVRIGGLRAKQGTVAQLHGLLPAVAIGEGKTKNVSTFTVDASLAKLTRDPEPILAVRVRIGPSPR